VRAALLDALCAAARVTATDEPIAHTLPPALAWTRALWSLGEDRAPLFAVHDLGWILLRGNDFRVSPPTTRPGDPRRADDLAWRDQALARWRADPSVREAHVVLAATPEAQRDDAVAHALSRCLPPLLRDLDLPRGNPAQLRGIDDELLAALDAPVDDDALGDALATRRAFLRALPDAALFTPEDLWEIAHRRALPGAAARHALRTLHRLVAAIPPCAPTRLAALRRGPAREILDAEGPGSFPAGGFDALATRGALENLVRSEAAYVGEFVPQLPGLDLFDLRLATDELLYYTRDESPLAGARRAVRFVVDAPTSLRVKQPSHPAQALVMVDALLLATHRDLLDALGPHAVHTALSWRIDATADRDAADEERALLSLAWGAELAHRRVSLSDAETPGAITVVLSPRDPSEEVPHDAWMVVRGETWRWEGASLPPGDLRAAVDAVLDRISR
jgi:vWA domain found in the FtsH ternary systems/N-terminal helical region fused to the FtsH ternary system vWA domain